MLVFRRRGGAVEVLLAHPGGPLFRHRDEWGIPKGLVEPGEELEDAARRELREETGIEIEAGAADLIDLGMVARGDKDVAVFAYEADLDPTRMYSNEFELEWPPRSGRRQRYPELDRYAYFELSEAVARIHRYQRPLMARLEAALAHS